MPTKTRAITNPHRLAAMAAGERQYLDPKPCPQEHVGPRYTSNGSCVTCSKETTKARTAAGGKQARVGKWTRNNGARKAAIATGAARYSTGAPCKQGHLAERNTRDGSCVECQRLHSLKQIATGARREWQRANAAEQAVRQKAWRQANAEKLKADKAAWRKANPGLVRALKRQRAAKIAASARHYTRADLDRICKLQKGRCAYCRASLKAGYEPDHITPVSKGGANDAANIQLTCKPCNRAKSGKMPLKFAAELGLLL